MISPASPFHLDNEVGYQSWRAQKLANYPQQGSDLIVEVKDPAHLSDQEYAALWQRIAKAQMAIYATSMGESEDKEPIRKLAAQFGLTHLDANWLSDEDGITSLTPQDEDGQTKGEFIPYTHRPIRWHTDGYYNPRDRRIWAMTLHCVRAADTGGVNDLYDHELAYIALRDANPDHIRALMKDDAMTIPAREDAHGVARAAESGPAFAVEEGQLHLRYTARTQSIAWKDDDATRSAVRAIEALLASHPMGCYTLRLEPGLGLICNNTLHTRSGFTDSPEHRRLLYRARYHDHLRNLRA